MSAMGTSRDAVGSDDGGLAVRGREAAVDRQDDAVHETGEGGEKEGHDIGHLLGDAGRWGLPSHAEVGARALQPLLRPCRDGVSNLTRITESVAHQKQVHIGRCAAGCDGDDGNKDDSEKCVETPHGCLPSVDAAMAAADAAYANATRDLPTPLLTRLLEEAVQAHQPPLVRGRRIKLRYAHQGGKNPPRIIVHGNQVEAVPDAYERYLVNAFRKQFRLRGTPVVVEFKGHDNPYAGRKNLLTKRQVEKRKRLQAFVRRKSRS